MAKMGRILLSPQAWEQGGKQKQTPHPDEISLLGYCLFSLLGRSETGSFYRILACAPPACRRNHVIDISPVGLANHV
jgi:hypothetical protein